MRKIIIIAAPSGSGKSTIVKQLLQDCPELSFSISATTRTPRGAEQHGKDYYYITVADFEQHIEHQDFLEWEMVYEGKYYGTLLSEMDRIYAAGQYPILDIDVMGAVKLKDQYKDKVLAIFIKAPSLAILEQRLRHRNTETDEVIKERLAKATFEMSMESHFDFTVINDDLGIAIETAKDIISREVWNA